MLFVQKFSRMILLKIHRAAQGRKIAALCDGDLYGKKFEDGELQLDLSSDFYNGTPQTEQYIAARLPHVQVINAVGKEAVALVVSQGYVEHKNVIYIKNIPHAQCVLM